MISATASKNINLMTKLMKVDKITLLKLTKYILFREFKWGWGWRCRWGWLSYLCLSRQEENEKINSSLKGCWLHFIFMFLHQLAALLELVHLTNWPTNQLLLSHVWAETASCDNSSVSLSDVLTICNHRVGQISPVSSSQELQKYCYCYYHSTIAPPINSIVPLNSMQCCILWFSSFAPHMVCLLIWNR